MCITNRYIKHNMGVQKLDGLRKKFATLRNQGLVDLLVGML